MNIRNLDLNLLVVFDRLADELSVTRAAERLGSSQPAVSHALARLRRALGDPLFVRHQRGLTPTARTQELRGPVKRMLADAEAIFTPVVFEPRTVERVFRLATTDYMLAVLLPDLAAAVRREAPRLVLNVSSLELANLRERMSAGDIDLAVTTPEFAEADFRSRFCYRDRYVCAMRRNHPLAGRLDLDSYCTADHLIVSPRGRSPLGPVDEALAKRGRKRAISVAVPNFLVVPSLLAATDMIAVLPERLMRLAGSELAIQAPPVELPDIDVIAVWHPRVDADPVHRWIRSRLRMIASGSSEGR